MDWHAGTADMSAGHYSQPVCVRATTEAAFAEHQHQITRIVRLVRRHGCYSRCHQDSRHGAARWLSHPGSDAP